VDAEVSEPFFRDVGIGPGADATSDGVRHDRRDDLSDDLRDDLRDDLSAADQRPRELRERIARLMRETIGVSMEVRIVRPGAAPRSEGGKLNRVVDRR